MITYNNLKEVIENNTSKTGKLFDIFIQSLIIFSLISFSLETLPDLSETFCLFSFLF